MKQLLLLTSLVFLSFVATAQSTFETPKPHESPVYFVDSIKVGADGLSKQEQTQIARIHIVSGNEAIAMLGDAGKNGIIYIETKPFARKRFERYFKTKSAAYNKSIKQIAGDTAAVQYILNDKVLSKNYEGDLAIIDDKVFKELVIVSKKDLKTKYGITNKQFGVAIKTGTPEVSNGK